MNITLATWVLAGLTLVGIVIAVIKLRIDRTPRLLLDHCLIEQDRRVLISIHSCPEYEWVLHLRVVNRRQIPVYLDRVVLVLESGTINRTYELQPEDVQRRDEPINHNEPRKFWINATTIREEPWIDSGVERSMIEVRGAAASDVWHLQGPRLLTDIRRMLEDRHPRYGEPTAAVEYDDNY